MASNKNKEFDAVEMSRRLRMEMSQKLASMSKEEQLAYFKSLRKRLKAEPLAKAS